MKWIEVYSHALSLNLTPLDIAPIFRRQMEGHPRAWIFASATLAVGQNFSHYCDALGLHEAEGAAAASSHEVVGHGLHPLKVARLFRPRASEGACLPGVIPAK